MTRFYDPSVQFLLQFEAPADGRGPIAAEVAGRRTGRRGAAAGTGDDGPKVVSLDQFRKK